MSVPIEHLDELLFSFAQKEWRKSAYVIGRVMSSFDETPVSDAFLATRLQALADAGRIEAVGDLSKIRFSEVRLTAGEPSAPHAP